ncbi:MAG: carboxymuconolactone decarboxylase family protein [Pseudonocardiaceae bacterium]
MLNIAGEMAHSPAVIAMYNAMNDAIGQHGTFDAATREAIALAVGNQDGCGYCQSAHTLSAVQAGFSEEQTVAIRNAAIDFDSRLVVLLAVAREIAANLGEVSDATYQRAQQAGWNDEQLTELYAHVAVNMFTNYFNHYARTELDIPAASGIAS